MIKLLLWKQMINVSNLHVVRSAKLFATVFTFVGLNAVVGSYMGTKVGWVGKCHVTFGTPVWFFSWKKYVCWVITNVNICWVTIEYIIYNFAVYGVVQLKNWDII